MSALSKLDYEAMDDVKLARLIVRGMRKPFASSPHAAIRECFVPRGAS